MIKERKEDRSGERGREEEDILENLREETAVVQMAKNKVKTQIKEAQEKYKRIMEEYNALVRSPLLF